VFRAEQCAEVYLASGVFSPARLYGIPKIIWQPGIISTVKVSSSQILLNE
jgi:hypothetical protein